MGETKTLEYCTAETDGRILTVTMNRPERSVQTQPLLAILLRLPGLQVCQHHRGECHVDFVEVEILQRQPVSSH